MDITPIFRIEQFLDAIINSTTPPEPIFREEFFLAKIAGADVETPEPIFRIEKYLAKIGGDDVEIPTPVFRSEYWLAAKCGEDVPTPTPVFRLEYFLEEWVNGSAPAYKKVTGKIVQFLTKRIAPLKIEATLEPIQDLHGYDSPWPGGGGKNLLNPDKKTVDSGGKRFRWYYDDGITLLANQAYTFSVSGSEQLITLYFMDKASGESIVSAATSKTYTPTVDTVVFLQAYRGEVILDSNNFQLELGSSATFYAPYSNECPISGHSGADIYVEDEYDATADPTVQITFGSTVYGGKLTVNEDGSGEVTVDRAMVTLDGSSNPQAESYGGTANSAVTRYTLAAYAKAVSSGSIVPNVISNYLKATQAGKAGGIANWKNDSTAVNTITTSQNGQYIAIAINDASISSRETLNVYLASNPLTVVYELATPITITLSPGQVNALLGNNTVWVGDSDNISVTYQSN